MTQRLRWRVFFLACTSAAAALAMAACAASTPLGGQTRRAAKLRPVALDDQTPWPAAVRKLKVRAYADAGHRAATDGWQSPLFRLVESVNPTLRSKFGVELEIVDLKDWDRERESKSLRTSLYELVRQDPGADVDLVIGLLAPLSRFTIEHKQLGLARVLGRHVVIRPVEWFKQYEALNRNFDRLEQSQRDDLFQALQKHHRAVTFLHQLGHVWGALHSSKRNRIMYAAATNRVGKFTPENITLMRTVLAARGDDQRDPAAHKAMLAAYRTALTAISADDSEEIRRRMLEALDGGPSRMASLTQTQLDPDIDPSLEQAARDDDAAIASQALEVATADPAAAWSLLQPVMSRHPKDAEYQTLGCQLALIAAPAEDETATQCTRAVRLAPGNVKLRLWRAAVWRRRAKLGRAIADAQAAQSILTKTSTAPQDQWNVLVSLYRNLLAVTWAEQAALRTQDVDLQKETTAWAAQIRDSYGLREDAATRGVPPAEEPRYLGLLADVAAAAENGDLDRVRTLEAELRRRYPQMPAQGVACRVLASDRKWAMAYDECRKMAKASPDSAEAMILVGAAALGSKRPADAVAPLEQALRLAPDEPEVWKLLARAYQATGKKKPLQRLKNRYQRQFGAPMP